MSARPRRGRRAPAASPRRLVRGASRRAPPRARRGRRRRASLAAPAHATEVTAAELRALAGRAADDPAALAELRAGRRRRRRARSTSRRRCAARAAPSSTRGLRSSPRPLDGRRRRARRAADARAVLAEERFQEDSVPGPFRRVLDWIGDRLPRSTSTGSTTCCPAGARSSGSCSARCWSSLAVVIARLFLTQPRARRRRARRGSRPPRATRTRARSTAAPTPPRPPATSRPRCACASAPACCASTRAGAIDFRPSISTSRGPPHARLRRLRRARRDLRRRRLRRPRRLARRRRRRPRALAARRGARMKGCRAIQRVRRIGLRWFGSAVLVVLLAVVSRVIDRLSPTPAGSAVVVVRDVAGRARRVRGGAAALRASRAAAADADRRRAAARDETLFVLEPDVMEPEEARAIGDWVRSGGHLVAGGLRRRGSSEVLDDPPAWRPSEPGTPARARARRRGARGRLARRRRLARARRRAAAARAGDGAAARVSARAARGAWRCWPTSSPLQNRGLARADNAALGIALAGGAERPVAFLETVHGYGVSRGFGGLPANVRWALLGLGADRAGRDLGGRAALRAGRGARDRARPAAGGLRRRARRRARCGPNRKKERS